MKNISMHTYVSQNHQILNDVLNRHTLYVDDVGCFFDDNELFVDDDEGTFFDDDDGCTRFYRINQTCK